MHFKRILITLLVGSIFSNSDAQNEPFQLAILPVNLPQASGVQSFAHAEHDAKWLIIGGRKDGLHRRQPWASFDSFGLNNTISVIDPIGLQTWSVSTLSLPTGIKEQISSTNMEFYQDGDMLYLIGGYGFSKTANDHVTYPNLTAIHVSGLMQAILDQKPISGFFRQITNQAFAVTGGYLNKLYDTYYLTGGQRFDGRYNPMGGPTFTQTYTNAIKTFRIVDDGTNLSVTFIKTMTDSDNLHRRDYNAVAQIMPNGQEGITAFSGVFQKDFDLPYLNCVNIDSASYSVNNTFAQYYNHYHCAHIPLYSAKENKMHTVFFGGIARYYDSAGTLVQDDNVPFVKTIARVSRDAQGNMTEYKLPNEMPGYLGAGSEFIYKENLPLYNNGVIKLDSITADSTTIGYIYGGISSSMPNIFFTNDGSQSSASKTLFKVVLLKNNASGVHQLNAQSKSGLGLQLFPNPNGGLVYAQFHLTKKSDVRINVYNLNGQKLETQVFSQLNVGKQELQLSFDSLKVAGMYYFEIISDTESAVQKITIQP